MHFQNGIKTNLESGGKTSLIKPLSKRFATDLVAYVRSAYFLLKAAGSRIILKIIIFRKQLFHNQKQNTGKKNSKHFRLEYHKYYKYCHLSDCFDFAAFQTSTHKLRIDWNSWKLFRVFISNAEKVKTNKIL